VPSSTARRAGRMRLFSKNTPYVQELVERGDPCRACAGLDGKTLHHFAGFRFAVFPKHGGRVPELENRDTLEWWGVFSGVSTPSAR